MRRAVLLCVLTVIVVSSGCIGNNGNSPASNHASSTQNSRETVSPASLLNQGFEHKSITNTKLSKDLTDVAGKPAFVGMHQGKQFIWYNNRYIAMGKLPDMPTDVDGKLAYEAAKNGKFVVVYNNNIYGKKHGAQKPFEYRGQLGYVIGLANGSAVHAAGHTGPVFDQIYDISTANNTLTYTADKLNETTFKSTAYKVTNGRIKQINENQIQLKNSIISSSKKVINAKKAEYYHENRSYYVKHGKQINGKLSYMERYGKKSYIVYGNKKIGPFRHVRDIAQVNNNLAFITADKNNQTYLYQGHFS